MGSINGQKLAGAAAVVFIAMTLISGFMVSPPPSPNESPAKFLEYYADHRNEILAQGIVALLANIPAFLFIAGFWNILRSEDRQGDVLATGSIFAIVAAGVLASLASAFAMGIAMSGDGNGLTEDSARTLGLISELVNPAIFSCMAPFALFSGWVLLRGERLPSWIGYVGIICGILLLAATFSVAMSGAFEPFGLLSFAGFLTLSLYAVLIGVFMWLRAEPARATA
jgi:hypothetical protein